MRRPVTELIRIFSIERKRNLSQPQCIGDSIHVSLFNQLSLQEHIIGRKEHCNRNHKQTCLKCTQMLKVATCVLNDSFCFLSSAFKEASPNANYQADTARKLLSVWEILKSFTLLIEKFQGMDFTK